MTNEFNPNDIKINSPSISKSIPKSTDATKQKSSDSNEAFFKILAQRMAPEQEQVQAQKQGCDASLDKSLGELEALGEIQGSFRVQEIDQSTDIQLFARKITLALDLLDAYAAALNDPVKTLKEASALLDSATASTRTLLNEYSSTDAGDATALELIKQLAATVEAEKIKLDRGDYTI